MKSGSIEHTRCICIPEQLEATSCSDLFPVPFQLGSQCWQGKIFSCYSLHLYRHNSQGRLKHMVSEAFRPYRLCDPYTPWGHLTT